MPAEVKSRTGLKPVRRERPLSVNARSGHRPDGRLNAISADEESQFTAVCVPGRTPGPRPLPPGAALNAIDLLVRLALLFR